MAIPTQRLKQKETTKDAIIEAAKTIILKEGWQAVSIRKIADAIGYSLPVVYNHFENKDAILEEFVKQGFLMLNEVMLNTKNATLNPDQQLITMATAYFEFAFSQRAYYQMMFGLGMPSCDRVNQIPEIAHFTELMIGTIQKLIAQRNEEKTKLKFHTFWSILHGLISINMVNMAATPNEMQQLVLLDAVQGFIKNIHN